MHHHLTRAICQKIKDMDWDRSLEKLAQSGWTHLPGILSSEECASLSVLYAQENGFRNRVIMARHGFGQGEYKYFSYPLPEVIADLRNFIYPRLVPLANQWNDLMGSEIRYPDEHEAFIQRCKRAGQQRPTPLLLKYSEGDYNCLHQDLYGEHFFPIQAVILLSEPEKEFTGGEFILTEQRPRMQSRAEVIPLRKGDLALFGVQHRPQKGTRGYYRVTLRHGVSKVRSGHRYAAGIIFHDAR